jgi:transcriptional regulator with XRE-family HTH domain
MGPKDFKRWRKSLGLSQKQAAEALGLKRRMVQYYEKGERDGESVRVPRPVRLACYALAAGVTDYHGPGSDGSGLAAGVPAKKAGKKADKVDKSDKEHKSGKKPRVAEPAIQRSVEEEGPDRDAVA